MSASYWHNLFYFVKSNTGNVVLLLVEWLALHKVGYYNLTKHIFKLKVCANFNSLLHSVEVGLTEHWVFAFYISGRKALYHSFEIRYCFFFLPYFHQADERSLVE